MKVKVCTILILAIMTTGALCRPAVPGAAGDPRRPPTSLIRRDWPESLSQEQQHLISRFLPPIFTDLGHAHGDKGTEALHDHFYPDWMDFGRRSAEDSGEAA
ncbi:gastrin/cholecystokinin-like peptide [Patagioenas fasciata]|uniref:gastrin/cholecystokinin-like peptide n=1 Tax=Patagioenas fasciata TaxID=372321 RepID=UPI003A99DEA5